KLLLVAGIIIISISLPIMGIMGGGESEKEIIAVFFGSSMDKKVSQEVVASTGISARYYNISKIQEDPSFKFDNESIAAIWWINELPLSIDLTFAGEINEWEQAGKGLFVLNRYFNKTPLQVLKNFGIKAYAPVVYPINGSFVKQELNIVENESILTSNITTFEVNCSTAWVEVDNQIQMLMEVKKPEMEPFLNDLTSGIWFVDSRVIVGSFSIEIPIEIPDSQFNLHEIDQATSTEMIDILGQLVQLTIRSLPSDNGIQIQFGDVNQLTTMGLVVIASVLSILVLIKVGVISKIREIVVGGLLSLFLFFAHIAYSPQRRRINETELLENELRGQIVHFLTVKGEQGAHLREIQREIGCGISSLLWHLQALDDFNLITHEKIGKYHIFYLVGAKSVQISEIALALKSDVAKELCRVLIRKGKPLSLSKISQEIDVHHSSIQHHIKRLEELGIIISLKEKKRSKYIVGPKRLSWLKSHLEVA
ncbi:MAG: HTH domain-containing protein, partial [Candidatus Heimdallarchaeota archaeon]